MAMSLLEKTRTINKLVQRSEGNPIEFEAMARVLSQAVDANSYIVGRRGKILGYAFTDETVCSTMNEVVIHSEYYPESFNQDLMKIGETTTNTGFNHECVFNCPAPCHLTDRTTTVVPILGGGERVGSLLLAKDRGEFTEDDLVMAEYGATVIGMEIMRVKLERAEEEARRKVTVQIAVGTLSYSELEAVDHIFAELGGEEGLLVASKIADRVGITRSVIVNALRKLESAGVIESKSLGMKGTYIRVLNEHLLGELKKLTKRSR